MPSFSFLTAALAFSGAVIASPVELEKRKAFTVEQVQRRMYFKNGPAEIIKTLRKYGKSVPQHLIDAAESNSQVQAASSTGTVPATPNDQYDSAYLCPVTVGSTVVELDFDTGSSDL